MRSYVLMARTVDYGARRSRFNPDSFDFFSPMKKSRRYKLRTCHYNIVLCQPARIVKKETTLSCVFFGKKPYKLLALFRISC